MKRTALASARDWVAGLFSEDDPDEPGYDPVHLGVAVVVTLTALGCLYWLLWTLLVYEGGLFLKAKAAARVAFTSATPADLGYEGPWELGAFEGWFGNVMALVFTVALAAALRRLYREASERHRSGR